MHKDLYNTYENSALGLCYYRAIWSKYKGIEHTVEVQIRIASIWYNYHKKLREYLS